MNMKKNLILASLIASAALAACGGGGGGGSSSGAAPASGASSTPAAQVPLNPYTNQQAPGASTTTVTGQVYNSGVTSGATVAAYLVNADGSNGALIGLSLIHI